MKKLTLLATVLLAFTLTTCSNPIDFVAEVTDQVMVANDKYLEVVSVTPVKGATSVNTYTTIDIEFDRAIDLDTVDETTVLISPSVVINDISWNASTNTLSVTPGSLQGLQNYTITLSAAVKGTDGSAGRTDYAWTFTTKKAPSGTLIARWDTGPDYNYDYAQSTTINLKLDFNTEAEWVRWSEDLLLFSGDTGWQQTNIIGTEEDIVLTDGDGERTIYYQFKDDTPLGNATPVASTSLVLDTENPYVDVGAPQTLNIAVSSKTINATSSDGTSGIKTWAWSKVSGAGTVTFGSASAEDTTVSMNADGTYVLRLTVTDNAGRVSTGEVTVYRDLTAPTITSAGGTQYLRRLAQTSNINATTTDASGIASWLWEKTSGPGTLTFGSASTEDTTVSGSADGTYTARLTVTDIRGNATQASITVYRDIVDPVITIGAFPAYLNVAAPSYATVTTVTEPNSPVYAWTEIAGTGDVSFSSASVRNPTISAVTDGTRTVRLTVTDLVGNVATADSTSMTIDRVAPGAPVLTTFPPSTATSLSVTWNWTSGGGGNGNYRYKLDSDAWSSDLVALTVTLSLSSSQYGQHSFYVEERDAAGNWSNYDSDGFFVYPSYLAPAQGTTVDRSPTITWSSGYSSLNRFDVFYKLSSAPSYTQLYDNSTTWTVTLPTGTLAASSTYRWYYTRTTLGITTRYPEGSGYFTFFTNATP